MADTDREDRLSPDALLAEAKRDSRGRFKIFLGAAPGVGKTYALLEAAHERQCLPPRYDMPPGNVNRIGDMIESAGTAISFVVDRQRNNPEMTPELSPGVTLLVLPPP